MSEIFEIKWLTGIKELKIKLPWIKQKTTKNCLGQLNHEYFIVLEYVTIGPFTDYTEAFILMKTYHV